MLIQSEDNAKLGWSLEYRDPKALHRLMPILDWLYRNYFHVQTSGWHHVPDGSVLMVGSHNGGLAAPDMYMAMYDWYRQFGIERSIFGLLHPSIWQAFKVTCLPLAQLAGQIGSVMAHPKMAIATLRSGSSVLVYPGGAQDVFRPYWQRNRINLAGRTGFIKLALEEEVPIVPLISSGAHDTLIVLADLYQFIEQLHDWGMPWLGGIDPDVFPVYLGLPWGVAFGPLPNIPLPVPIQTRVCPPIVFERYGREAACDLNYVQSCYEIVRTQMQQELDALVSSKPQLLK
ncbi:MAG: lysophospholipid acyltransferase family protein [Thermosynechococcaceae cyanobacterium]